MPGPKAPSVAPQYYEVQGLLFTLAGRQIPEDVFKNLLAKALTPYGLVKQSIEMKAYGVTEGDMRDLCSTGIRR